MGLEAKKCYVSLYRKSLSNSELINETMNFNFKALTFQQTRVLLKYLPNIFKIF